MAPRRPRRKPAVRLASCPQRAIVKRPPRSLLLGTPPPPSFPVTRGAVGREQEALPLARCGTLTLSRDPWGPAVPCGRGSPAVSSQNGLGRQKGCCLARVPHPLTSEGWLGPGPGGTGKAGGQGTRLGSSGRAYWEHVFLCPGRGGRAGQTPAAHCSLCPGPRPVCSWPDHRVLTPRLLGPRPPPCTDPLCRASRSPQPHFRLYGRRPWGHWPLAESLSL